MKITIELIEEIFQEKTEETFQEIVEKFNLKSGDLSPIQQQELDRLSNDIVSILYDFALSNS